jgi:ribulose-phosphate 3-epimerase
LAEVSEARIFASLTSLDPAGLGEAALRLLSAGVDGLHIDVADGVFVPDITYGPRVVAALRRLTEGTLDVHLMVSHPERTAPAVAEAGASRVSFHIESTRNPWRVASLVKRYPVEVGIAVNPVTPLATLEALGESVDFVNLLTTDPDLSGERLLPRMADRVFAASSLLPGATAIEVDGDIGTSNISLFASAGASEFVVGRSICGSPNWTTEVTKLKAQVRQLTYKTGNTTGGAL